MAFSPLVLKRLSLAQIIFLFLLATALNAELIPHQLHKNQTTLNQFEKIKFLDSKEIRFKSKKGIEFHELSGIEYKNGRLYGLSDRGYLYHMSINIENDKIKSLSLDKAIKLKTKKTDKVKVDTEGIILVDDSVYISFERNPKVEKFSLNGKKIKSKKIPKDLKKIKNYHSLNKGLEAIAYSEKYGVLTAPELPLKNKTEYMHAIYSKDQNWYFKLKAPISSMAFMSKHKLLVIQRDYDKKSNEGTVYLTQVNLNKCTFNICSSKVLAKLETEKGWNIDNFEGLAKIDKNRYLMISDNNDSPLQKTLLVLFEVL